MTTACRRTRRASVRHADPVTAGAAEEPDEPETALPAVAPADDAATLDARVAEALQASLAANTWRAYASDWRHWSAWAIAHGVDPLPAGSLDLARYLVDSASACRVGTLTRRLSAV